MTKRRSLLPLAISILFVLPALASLSAAPPPPAGPPAFLAQESYARALTGLFEGCRQVGFTWYRAAPRGKASFHVPLFVGFDGSGAPMAAAIVLKPRAQGKLVVATGIRRGEEAPVYSAMHLVEEDAKGPLRKGNWRGRRFFKQFRDKKTTEKLRLHGTVDGVSGATRSGLGLVRAMRDALPWLKDGLGAPAVYEAARSNPLDLLDRFDAKTVAAEFDEELPRPKRRRKLFGFLPLPF